MAAFARGLEHATSHEPCGRFLGDCVQLPAVSTTDDHRDDAPIARRRAVALSAALFATAVLLYSRSFSSDFVNLDDPQYVTHNPYIVAPSWEKLAAFFTEVLYPTTVAGYYQPLTMASLMLDRVIDGTVPPRPLVYHVTNVLLHGLNAVLLFLWLRQTLATMARNGATGATPGALLTPAFVAAMLFALHPANVESVAWVCQRKSLLSTTFALAMFLAYGRYVRTRGFGALLLTHVCFVLSMLSKPTGWLLPVVLLALDWWPYRRLSVRSALEKLPLLALAGLGGWIALVSQAQSMGRAELTVLDRPMEGAAVIGHNVVFYLWKLVCPAWLSPQYPMPLQQAWVTLTNSTFLLCALAAVGLGVALAATAWRGRRGALVALGGYFVLMGPVIGAVDFMGAIAADRFTYLPMLLPMLGLAAWLTRHAKPRLCSPLRFGFVLLMVALAAKTWTQQGAWRDSFAYWNSVLSYLKSPEQHIRYDPEKAGILSGLANAHIERFYHARNPADRGRPQDLAAARTLLNETIRLRPTYSQAYFRLAELLLTEGRAEEALAQTLRGLAQPGADEEGHFYLGAALVELRRFPEAIEAYQLHLNRRPASRETLRNLANALCLAGRWSEAEPLYERLTRLDPADAEAFYGLGRTRLELHGAAQAVSPLEQARVRKPNEPRIRFVLAACYAVVQRDNEALAELSAAVALQPDLAMRAERQPEFAGLRGTPAWEQWKARLREGAGVSEPPP